jgi:hypothetical protein
MDEHKAALTAESACRRLGDLVASALPGAEDSIDAREWASIASELEPRSWWRSPRWRWASLAFSAVALACVCTWFLANRPLGYRVEGCTAVQDGSFVTGAERGGLVAFEDGSTFELDKNTRFRLQSFRRGADFFLDEGRAAVAVFHRVGARWAVLAGPFRVEVTGTRFDAAWDKRRDSFKVTMVEGEVRILGGMLAKPVYLRAGQTLESDVARASVIITDDRQGASEHPPANGAPAASVPSDQGARPESSTAPSPSEALPRGQARKRVQARGELVASQREPLPAGQPSSRSSSFSPQFAIPIFPSADPEPMPDKPRVGSVEFRDDGHLRGPLSGFAWVTGGEGTVFTPPKQADAREHLRPVDGQFCTNGRVVGIHCANEDPLNARCNWDRNWGVALGWFVREDESAWGSVAAGGISVEFRGRSTSYRLNAHRKGDPDAKIYCIENYKSGQVVTPAMFKSECWAGRGETLADFRGVDLFNLQFSSGKDYVAFRYCISAITLHP